MQKPSQPICLQQKAVESWVRRQLGSVDHEKRVAEISARLFDLTWPLHGLGRPDRKLLRLAAIVHDVGRSIDDERHPQEGARMVLDADHLPLSASERRALAYLTRHHRGKVPDAGCDRILGRTDDHERLRLTLALLRAADALDSRAIESPRLVFALLDRRLQITCYLAANIPKARKVYARRKKFRLLEELLGCDVDLRIDLAHALLMVA